MTSINVSGKTTLLAVWLITGYTHQSAPLPITVQEWYQSPINSSNKTFRNNQRMKYGQCYWLNPSCQSITLLQESNKDSMASYIVRCHSQNIQNMKLCLKNLIASLNFYISNYNFMHCSACFEVLNNSGTMITLFFHSTHHV